MELDERYDAIDTAIFLPSGGSRRVRRRLVDALGVQPRQRVLELGCGTGQVTQLLLEAGADVIAVDAHPEMLAGARRRAPDAMYIESDVFEVECRAAFDRVVLSFLLHSFESRGRVGLLRRAAAALRPGGRVGVLDWDQPQGQIRASLWRRLLGVLEPSDQVPELLDGALEEETHVAGLRVLDHQSVAGGRAQIMVLQPG